MNGLVESLRLIHMEKSLEKLYIKSEGIDKQFIDSIYVIDKKYVFS